MSDRWLDSGHGDGLSLVPVRPAPEIGVAEGRSSGVWRSRSGRGVVAMIAVAAVIGSAGTAYAIRETLFPSIGPATSRSVWQNPAPDDEPVPVSTISSPTTSTSTSTTLPSTNSLQVSNDPLDGVPQSTRPDDSGGSPGVSDESGKSGYVSNELGPNGSDPVVSGSGSDDSSGSGSERSGSDGSTGASSGGSGSDDGVDPLRN